jgi:flagellar export protein FliJ
MKIPSYPLKPVLEIREKIRDNVVKELSEAKHKLQIEQEKQHMLEKKKVAVEDEKKDVRQKMEKKMFQKTMRVADAMMYHDYMQRLVNEKQMLDKDIVEQSRYVEQSKKDVEKVMHKLVEKDRDVKVIETHKANWEEKQKKEIAKKEQDEEDEIARMMYSKRQM